MIPSSIFKQMAEDEKIAYVDAIDGHRQHLVGLLTVQDKIIAKQIDMTELNRDRLAYIMDIQHCLRSLDEFEKKMNDKYDDTSCKAYEGCDGDCECCGPKVAVQGAGS